MHHDHGNDVSTCLSAIRNGFTSVMMDGSLKADAKTPADYDYNAGVTRTGAELAHMVGASVEGDLGCLGSLESGKGASSGSVRSWPRALSLRPASTRWPSPSGRPTERRNSVASPMARCWPWT